MKIIINALLTFVLLIFTYCLGSAQEFPKLDKSPMDAAYYPNRAAFRFFQKSEDDKIADKPVIRVLYSRPKKNDRDIFPEIVKPGELWRAGANEGTEIMFFEDVKINDTKVKAGRYTFYIMPNESEWTVLFNTVLDNWGHYTYDEAMTIAKITVPVEKAKESIEAFSIVFETADDGAHMIMGWDDVIARVPIQVWK